MKRREVLALIGGVVVAWPLAGRAQQPATAVVGFLGTGTPESDAWRIAALRQGLDETGYTEGRNVAIEFRWARGEYDQLQELAADLVGGRWR